MDAKVPIAFVTDSSPRNASAPDFLSEPLVSLLLRHRRVIVGVPAVMLAFGLAFALLRQPQYTAESRVRPVTNNANANRFQGLAAQFGLALPVSSDPIKLYAEMALSNSVMRGLLGSRIVRATEPREVTLIALLDAGGSTERERNRRGADRIKKRLEVLPNEGSGTIRIRYTDRDPAVAEQVNRRVLQLVDSLSMEMRHGQASAERQFIATRLAESQAALREAEQALEAFNRMNRVVSSPTLEAEQSRLQRQVDFRQQVAVGLAQSFEQARIDEVRNTPVLGILDRPEGTAKRAGRMRDIVIWPMTGLVMAIAIVLSRELWRRSATLHPKEWAEVRSLFRRRGAREVA